MTDEDRWGGVGTIPWSDARGRRQALKLMTAGVLGGAVGAGLNGLISDDGDEGIRVGPEDDSRSYDVVLFERDDGYVANDSDDETIYAGSDGWAALRNGIDAVPAGGAIFVSGRFGGTSTIEIGKSIRMDGHEAYVEHESAGDYVFRFQGTERHQTALADAAVTGDNAVELDDTSGMQKGDLVLLEEVDGAPLLGRDQPPGEPHSVLEVDGSTVRLEDSIVWREDYPPGTLAYVVDPIEVHVSGFSMTAPAKDGNYYGVLANQCRDSTLEDLWLDQFGSRGIVLEACANSRVRDCTVLQSSNIEAADGYGIQVWAGCHDIVVEGCAAKECRHPLSVTPGGPRDVPSRAITFRDCFVTSDGSAALNCHGGAAHDVRFEGCMVHTWDEAGVRTGAQETNVSGCEFRMNSHHAIDTRNDGQEMVITVTDTDIYGATSAVHLDNEEDYEFDPLWELVHVEGVRAHGCNRFFQLESGPIDRVRNVVLRGCYWDEVEEDGLRIGNRIDGGTIEGNEFGAVPGGSHVHVREDADGGVTNLHVVGNRFRRPRGTDPFVRLAYSWQCVVSDNKFEAASDVDIYVDGPDSTANLIKQNTYHAPDASPDPVAEAAGSRAVNNYVYDTNAEAWL